MDQKQTPTDSQVGGNHYKDMAIQPTTFIHANGIGFIAGNVIKYVCRHKAKGGKQDLEKAAHYLQMLISMDYPEKCEPKPQADDDGWIPWSGGECPVDPETMIIVNMDWLGNSGRQRAGSFDWSVSGGRGDIIAYRIA